VLEPELLGATPQILPVGPRRLGQDHDAEPHRVLRPNAGLIAESRPRIPMASLLTETGVPRTTPLACGPPPSRLIPSTATRMFST